MPGKIRKKKNGRVTVRWGKKVVAKNTTVKKAKAQLRLLNAIKHSKWRPTNRKKSRRL